MAETHHIESSVSTFIGDIRKFIKFFTRYTTIDGVIEAVYPDKFTCDIRIQTKEQPQATDTIYTNVPLKVLKGVQASFVEIPTLKTRCEFTFRDGNNHRPQLLMVDQCDQYLIQINGQSTLSVDKNGWIFNGGSDFMVFASKITTKINNLENAYNDLVIKYNNHVHSGVTTGTGSSAVTTSLETTVITPTIVDDIKNVKIKH